MLLSFPQQPQVCDLFKCFMDGYLTSLFKYQAIQLIIEPFSEDDI